MRNAIGCRKALHGAVKNNENGDCLGLDGVPNDNGAAEFLGPEKNVAVGTSCFS